MTDLIVAPIRTLLDLFTGELAEVKFPDLDAQVLARAADEVRSAAETVARAEGALEAARAVLAENQDALCLKSQRALSYARIFAEDNPELSSRLEGIAITRPARRANGHDELVLSPEPQPSRRRTRVARSDAKPDAKPAQLDAATPEPTPNAQVAN